MIEANARPARREALRGPRSTKQYVGAYAGRCRFRKVRARLMVRTFSSVGSFQGNTVISAFGQSDATSTEAIGGCAATSSGSTNIDVWHAQLVVGECAPWVVDRH